MIKLTDERIEELWVEHGLDECDPGGFARTIEAEVLRLNGGGGGNVPNLDEMAAELWRLYGEAAKISGSALLAGEKCPASDKAALYRIACEVLSGVACVYSDITGEWPNLQAPHKSAPQPQQAAPGAVLEGWIAVEQQMPKSGQIVLALQKWNHSGVLGIIRAAWVAAKTEESSSESDIGEYDEATDTYYDPEGWYEQIAHWDEISAAGVSGATIVAWMPLPSVTLSAAPQPQGE